MLSGLPRARSARGTEPHTHRIWSIKNLFSYGCHVTDRAYVRTYVRVSLRGRRKKGRGERGGVRQKGKREGSACSKSLCFCITPTNFLVIRLRLLSIKCRYTRQSERKAEPCGYAEIYLICRELTLHKYLSKREILTSGQPEI